MPIVGVGGVVIHGGKVLLIRRGKEPLRGRWTIPGGTLELGETLEAAVVREIREETGIGVDPVELMNVFDKIERRGTEVRFHYVIVDYLCRYVDGAARAASDADDVAWSSPSGLRAFDLPLKAQEVVEDGFRRAGRLALAPGGE